MITEQPIVWGFFLVANVSLCLAPTVVRGEPYDLQTVKGMEVFNGSKAARELLARNGFVVADPSFKQIFEAYIESPQTEEPSGKNPMGLFLPSFITTDSGWDTYHVLLEDGVQELEELQAQRLLKFSRELWAIVQSRNAGSNLLAFVSVGRALQDGQFRHSLPAADKRIVDGLLTGSEPVRVPIGFPLSPLQFRAQSFYTQSPELSAYFAARQWYASVVFRLADARETRSAVTLAALVNENPDLLALWKGLSDPFDKFLAPAEDGTLRQYSAVAASVLGAPAQQSAISDSQFAEIREKLDSLLPRPRVNDQLLLPEEYAEFEKATRGFRLLPPRRLPSAVCFQNTVDPKIPGRMYPSGLDFMAASPVLRSPAAVRAVQSQLGKSVGDLVVKADCGPMPESLHSEALRLLAKLQEPLPSQAPPALRTEAWADRQLWTQLGAWAEQRHTWALHSKLSVMYMGMVTPPAGMVAPYPAFFAGLAKLSRQTAAAFKEAGLDPEFDARIAGGELLNLLDLRQKLSTSRDYKALQKNSAKLEQLEQFEGRYSKRHRTELERNGPAQVYKQMSKDLEDLGRRGSSGQANEAETKTLREFFDCRQNPVRLLDDFAPVCDRLAELAGKALAGERLTEDDAKWIRNYGVALAGFHFYYGNSYEVPRDDFPIVTRVFSNPLTGSLLYAGLARPQALYVIVPTGTSLQLYRGAVMTYREFVRPAGRPLDDLSWRKLVVKGQTPSAPVFTRSFCAEKSAAEWIKALRDQLGQEVSFNGLQDIFWNLGSRATAKELPELLQLMAESTNSDEDVTAGTASIIARLDWEPYQSRLIQLLASPDTIVADCAAQILLQRSQKLDTTTLISQFPAQPVRTRRLFCMLLSAIPEQTEATGKALLQASQSLEAGIRWQAMLAIGKAHWKNEPPVAALARSLKDPNQNVAAVAVLALVRLGATNMAPALMNCLKVCVASPALSPEEQQQQAQAITRDFRRSSRPVGGYGGGIPNILDPDDLGFRMRTSVEAMANAKRMAAMRLPPRAFVIPTHAYGLTDALIEALADLGYTPAVNELFKLRGTDYDAVATRALRKLAPDRLADELLATARNQKTDSYTREQALITLCNISPTNRVRDLIPLLEDTTPILYSRPLPGPQWRICDRAAATIAILLGWHDRLRAAFISPDEREKTMTRVRDWAKEAP